MRAFTARLARRKFLLSAACLPVLSRLQAADAPATPTAAPSTNKPPVQPGALLNLNEFLEPLRATGKVPALTAALILDGKLRGVGAVGIRKGGSPVPVRGTDLWHIGSCTKPMTATLAAMQVDRRKAQWEMTIAEVLPELRDLMDPSYQDVTLAQLLSHRGGFPAQANTKLWDDAWAQRGTPTEQRYEFAKALLAREPEAPPNSKFIYSNQGYAVAGVMLEKITGQTWESLMRDQVFRPLMMTMSGFGVPGTVGQLDQPWGHKWKNGKLEPQQVDNPPAIAPAAGVHCTIWDFARFAMFNLNGANGEGRLLRPETFSRLYTPPAGQEYALGWSRQDRVWAQGHTLNHHGSNTLNFASIWLAPKIKFAAMAITNIGGESGEKACDETIQALIRAHVGVEA